jgi:uncharacterized membrane protein YfcA
MTETVLPSLHSATLLELLVISWVAGVGISTVGPGGILMTIGLYSVTVLPPASVAGTSIVTHIATGVVGTAAYLRSGQLRHPPTRQLALMLGLMATVGTPLGVFINGRVSHRWFGILLGLFAAVVGLLVWYRQVAATPETSGTKHGVTNGAVAALIGLGVAVAAGMFGLGGPMMAVPLLVATGVPILSAVAVAQVYSLVISTVGTFGYGAHHAIDWPMAIFVGIPEMTGVLIGWWLAHRIPPSRLRYALAIVLISLAPYLAMRAS